MLGGPESKEQSPARGDPVPEVTQAISEKAAANSEDVVSLVQWSPESKVRAYELFLSTSQTPDEIALNVSVPGFLVRHWMGEEKWSERKAKFETQLFKRIELEHTRFVMEHRLDTAKRHLITARMLENEVQWVLENLQSAREANVPPGRGHDMTLVRLSQALKNATDVSARVVGISDKPPLTEAEAAKTIILIGGRPLGDPAASARRVNPESVTVSGPLPASPGGPG